MDEYHEIFEAVPDGITVHDARDGTILDANQQFCEMLGYTREELLELGFEALHVDEPPYTNERAEQYIQKAATEGHQTFEWRDETKDGDVVPVEVHLKQTSIGDDQCILAVVRDITERKRRERELERIYDQIEFALDATDTVIWTLDLATGDSTDYGPVDRLFGTQPDGLDEFLTDVVHPADTGAVADLLDDVQSGETVEFDAEFRAIAGDGEVTWVASKGYRNDPSPDESPKLIGLATDITARKDRQEELQRKNERLEEFASIVSHDLRNPLNVAQGHLELLEADCPSEHVDQIRNAHERMESLIGDMLALAREGDAATNVQPVSLAALVRDCWQHVDTADAALTTETDGTVRADPGLLQQVLENLFRNAVEHGGESVTVTVGTVADGFYVADDGRGIPDAVHERLSDAGYSGSDTRIGFGLKIVTQIAETHDWDVAITESAEGGARIEFRNVELVS